MPTDASKKGEWERHQWEGEGQDDQPVEGDRTDDVPHWHKQQWEGEGQDDIPHGEEDRLSPEIMGEGDSELSGHGHNLGGGKRWGMIDRGEDKPAE